MIHLSGGQATITNSLLSHGVYGVRTDSPSTLFMSNSEVAFCNASGVSVTGSLDLHDSHIHDNSNGGVSATGEANLTGNHIQNNGSYGISTTNGPVTIYDNLIESDITSSNYYGIVLTNLPTSTSLVTNNTIPGFYAGIHVSVTSGALSLPITSIHDNTIADNTINGLLISGSPTENSTIAPTQDLTYVISGLTIPSGTSLTVNAGTIIKVRYSSLNINGTCTLQGTADNPVYITSLKDDSVGGDTNNDGSDTQPAVGDWYGININAGGIATFDHSILRYGGYSYSSRAMIHLSGGQATITNSLLSHGVYGVSTDSPSTLSMSNSEVVQSVYAGVQCTGGNLSIFGNNISENTTGISISGTPSVLITNHNIVDNTQYGI